MTINRCHLSWDLSTTVTLMSGHCWAEAKICFGMTIIDNGQQEEEEDDVMMITRIKIDGADETLRYDVDDCNDNSTGQLGDEINKVVVRMMRMRI